MKLRRSVPFITTSTGGASDHWVFLVDRAEVPVSATSRPEFERMVTAALEIERRSLSADAATALVQAQYDACLEYIFSHPLWPRLREGTGAQHLPGYVLENRHYLAAASFRMAAGIPGALQRDALVELLAKHVVEEADHNVFFENALWELGCPPEVVAAARPNPVTVEWIFLMRVVASQDPLCAALCSGLLETTARERDAVRGWHEMLSANGLLPAPAVDAMFEHVAVDLGLGHGAKWLEAVGVEAPISARHLAKALNAITLVAEQIVRWLDAVSDGLSSDVVAAMPTLELDAAFAGTPSVGLDNDGSPVWPAEILHQVVHGSDLSPGSAQAIAVAYAFADRTIDKAGSEQRVSATARALTRLIAPAQGDDVSGPGLEGTVRGWLRAIDGHALWHEMQARPSYALVYGWLLENYHYISAIGQCTGAAVASCPDPVIRGQLVHHLEEEREHGALLRKALEGGPYPEGIDFFRPLSTSAAFFGSIRDVARRDWKAYCVALSYLQLSLGTTGQSAARHSRFYDEVAAHAPTTGPLLDAMRAHDAEDWGLDHECDTRELLATLSARHRVTEDTLKVAGIVPLLSWSFLDGIRVHYARGDAAVRQRVGWRVGD